MKHKLEIHSENILPIIKKWLYSEHDIFLRELVSNASDAIQKVRLLEEKQEIPTGSEFKIAITVDKDKKTLSISDNGIGMDAEEVVKYIAQIAFSGAEDFVSKYKTGNEKDQFIGHFGLGFYSSYMVSDKVEVDTLSYKPGAKPVLWSCDGSSEYEMKEGTRKERGTTVTLFLNKESEEFLDETRLKHVLNRYCQFFPFPIYLNGERVNTEEPLWLKSPSECTKEEYLKFYQAIEPYGDEPLFWVHLNVDYPFHLKGILYFPKIRKDFDFNRSTVKLFCNRVFVSDNCKDLIPEYLAALNGVIDSPDIPLNVSRSYLQMDRTVRQLSGHIAKKVADSLAVLYRNEKERFEGMWNDISTFVKLGAIQDDKFFEKVKEVLIFKSLSGEWKRLSDLGEKIIYTVREGGDDPLHRSFTEKNKDVVILGHPIDPYLIQSIEKNCSGVTFERLDASVEAHVEGDEEDKELAAFIEKEMGSEKVEVEAKGLKNRSVPAMLVMEEGVRRMRDYMARLESGKGGPSLMDAMKRKMVVNTHSPLIKAIKSFEQKDPELAKELVREVYELALLHQREMDEKGLAQFIQRTHAILETLAEKVVGS